MLVITKQHKIPLSPKDNWKESVQVKKYSFSSYFTYSMDYDDNQNQLVNI